MKPLMRNLAPLLAVAGLFSACSGMGTTMTKVNRLRQNRGYEVASEITQVQQSALEVLKARGYEVSVKTDPENGAEGAGVIIIGQRVVNYSSAPGAVPTASEAPKQMDTRDLVDVYLSKKWQMSSNLGVPNLTLVDIVGSSYLRKAPSMMEEETPLTAAYIALLRDEIERNVIASRSVKAAK